MSKYSKLPYFIFALSVIGLYVYISYPLKTFFWGNMGDELFIGANLQNMLNGGYFSDFYYQNLPPFYPPLYFWVTGFISHFFTESAVIAGKIGASISLTLWFLIPYFIWRKNKEDWWILLLPIISICVLPFQDIITKPYEALSALLCIYWLVYFLKPETYNLKQVVFFGVSAGLLFMTYYFWWFLLIPITLIFFLLNKSQLISAKLKNLLIIGGAGLVTISPYLIPLLYSFYKYGIENNQGRFFRLSELNIWHGFLEFSIPGIILLLGVISLIYLRKNRESKILLGVLAAGYAYWIIGFITFKLGGHPQQMLKPFHFLVTIALCAGFSLLTHKSMQTLEHADSKWGHFMFRCSHVLMFIFLLQNPLTTFAFNKDIQSQLQKDLRSPNNQEIITTLKQRQRGSLAQDARDDAVWLSSGTPELNLYIPLRYYLAHNAHFSHSASQFSQRLENVKSLNLYQSQELSQKLSDLKITGLILYCENNTCPINVEVDNFPNGAKNIQINLDGNIIQSLGWEEVYNKNGWIILENKEQKIF